MTTSSTNKVCHVCKQPVPDIINFGNADPHGWNLVNVAPDAASGGTMRPQHWKCSPQRARPTMPAAPAEKSQEVTVYHHCKAHEHIPWRTTVTAYAGMVATVCPICEQRKEKK